MNKRIFWYYLNYINRYKYNKRNNKYYNKYIKKKYRKKNCHNNNKYAWTKNVDTIIIMVIISYIENITIQTITFQIEENIKIYKFPHPLK